MSGRRPWIRALGLTALLCGLTAGLAATGRAAVTFPPPAPGSGAPPVRYFPQLPTVAIPQTTGLSFGALQPADGILAAAQTTGFHWARVPLVWAGVESKPGTYDFTAADDAAEALRRHGLAPLFVIAPVNPLYDGGATVGSDAGRAALSAFAREAGGRYRKAAWEIASGDAGRESGPAYAAAALAAARALHRADPRATVLAAAGPDPLFLQSAFGHGLADGVDGIALRLPAGAAPEAAMGDLLGRYQAITDEFSPSRPLPVWAIVPGPPAGEGPDAGEGPAADERRAGRLVRASLYDFGRNVPVTVWDLSRPGDLAPGGAAERAAGFMDRFLDGIRLKRTHELPAPLHGLEFSGRHREIHVFWSDAGDSTLSLRLRGSGQAVSAFDVFGNRLPEIRGPVAVIHAGEAPVYVEGAVEIAGAAG